MRKTYHVQAMSRAGQMLFDVTIDTRAAQTLAQREALSACLANGGGWMRTQTEDARGWAVYAIGPGDRSGIMVFKDEAEEVNASFARWKETGGAGFSDWLETRPALY